MTHSTSPLWASLLALGLAGAAIPRVAPQLAARPAAFDLAAAQPPRPPLDPPPTSWDLASLTPRELMSLPGIGESLALAIARARWERPPGAPVLLLEQVPGIGAGITAGVRAWLEEAAARGDPIARRAAAEPPPVEAPYGSGP